MSLLIKNELNNNSSKTVNEILVEIKNYIEEIKRRKLSIYGTKTQANARKELIEKLSIVEDALEIIDPFSDTDKIMQAVISIKKIIDNYYKQKKNGIQRGKNWKNSINFDL